jgi:thioredoxin 1
MSIKVIFNKAHEEEIYRSEKAVICFSAKWCNPCNNFSPTYSTYADIYKSISFYKVDINEDENNDLINKFDITSVPTFIFLQKGVKINQLIGVDENKFSLLIQEL